MRHPGGTPAAIPVAPRAPPTIHSISCVRCGSCSVLPSSSRCNVSTISTGVDVSRSSPGAALFSSGSQ